MKKTHLTNLPTDFLQNSGWNWTTNSLSPYISNELIEVTENEAAAFQKAGEELYKLFIEAAEWVIRTKNYEQIGIPENMIPLIEYSWEHDNHWHLYGRFDLSGGLDGQPIKLIEFNADTATCIPETAIIQWACLMANGFEENKQYNSLFETLVETFRKLKTMNSNLAPKILFSGMEGSPEDNTNIEILFEAAKSAGFEVAIEYIENIEFSKEEGIFIEKENGEFENYPFWFKLIPWEFIAWDEPDLLEILQELVKKQQIIILNPAYTLLFQSKGLLKILWDLNPNHPLLLETKFEPIYGQKSVKKVMFGREGANVQFISGYGTPLSNSIGEYQNQLAVYQAYTDFLKNEKGSFLQAGLFYSGESCALGFRAGGEIIDDTAMFCGHIIAN